jgi:hypothetical protein
VTADDNMGVDGMGELRVLLNGRVAWRGAPAVGPRTIDVPLAGVPDGHVMVQVQQDGDGTAGASAGAPALVDRVGPNVSVTATRGTNTQARVSVAASVAGAGLAGWVVYAGAVGGPVVASGTGLSWLGAVDLTPYAAVPGGVRLVAVALDNVGRTGTAVSEPVAPVVATPAPVEPTPPPRPPEVYVDTRPDAGMLVGRNLNSPQGRWDANAGALLVDGVRGRAVTVRGTLVSRGNKPLTGVVVYLLNPSGRIAAHTLTGPKGGYRFVFRPGRPGSWSIESAGRPAISQQIDVRVGRRR